MKLNSTVKGKRKTLNVKNQPKNSAKKNLPAELFELEQQVGLFMQYWGFKNIHGRIWTHLYTAKSPLESREIMDRLQVSKGLMSLAMRDLLDYQVILEDHVGKHGTVFYKANPQLGSVITNVLKQRESLMLEQTQTTTQKILSLKESELDEAGVDRSKVQIIDQMTQSASALLTLFLMQNHDNSPLFSNFQQKG